MSTFAFRIENSKSSKFAVVVEVDGKHYQYYKTFKTEDEAIFHRDLLALRAQARVEYGIHPIVLHKFTFLF